MWTACSRNGVVCVLLAGVLLAGCAGNAPEPGPADPGDGRSSAPRVGPLVGNGTFVVDYAYRMEACPTGADNYLRSDQTAVRIGRPEGATRLNVTFTWDPGNPTADRLRFTLVDRDGMDVAPVVEGVSPLTLDLAEADLAKTTEDPWIAGEPAPCHGAPGGVLDVGSAPGQVVAYEATWS